MVQESVVRQAPYIEKRTEQLLASVLVIQMLQKIQVRVMKILTYVSLVELALLKTFQRFNLQGSRLNNNKLSD